MSTSANSSQLLTSHVHATKTERIYYDKFDWSKFRDLNLKKSIIYTANMTASNTFSMSLYEALQKWICTACMLQL